MIEEVYYIEGDHIFQDLISVVFTDDIEACIDKQCMKLHIDNPWKDSNYGAACVCTFDLVNKKGKRVASTWMLFNVNKINPGIIVHESVHLSFKLMYKRGLKHKPSTDEVYAYTTQWVFNKVSGFYADYLKSTKVKKVK